VSQGRPQHVAGQCSIDRRLERDRQAGRVTSEAALTFVGKTCPCPACYERRRRWRAEAAR